MYNTCSIYIHFAASLALCSSTCTCTWVGLYNFPPRFNTHAKGRQPFCKQKTVGKSVQSNMKFLLLLTLVGFIGVQAQNAPAIVIRPPDTTATETQTVRFTCAAYGLPMPAIGWWRGNEDLTTLLATDGSGLKVYAQTITVNSTVFTVSVLEICGVNQTSNADFTCLATNGVNFGSSVAPSSATFSLTVTPADQQPPAIVVRPSDQTVDYGSTVEAVCVAYGNPLPTISWAKTSCQSCDVSEGMGTSLVSNDVVSYGDVSFTKSTLRLCGVEPRDSGTFRCSASNGVSGSGIGQSSWEYQLSVNQQPVVTTTSIVARPTETTESQLLRNVAAEHAYQAVIGIETVVIVILIVVIVILIFAAYKMSSSREKATIEIPGFGRAQATNPIYDQPPDATLPQSVNHMTYAELSEKLDDTSTEAQNMKKSLID